MGNQQPTGRTRSDTYTRYERDGEDGRYVTLDHNDSSGSSHPSSIDDRVSVEDGSIDDSFIHSLLSSFHQDTIQLYQFEYEINDTINTIRCHRRLMPNYKMKRRQFLLFSNIRHHRKIKKPFLLVHLQIGKIKFQW